jgi:predicted alpha/beta-hydrolase family hydrolase
MMHPFMKSVASGLEERQIATLQHQFPYMEKGARRPDPPAKAHAAVRAAVAKAAELCGELPIVAGGKSFGSRMTSQA